VKTQNFALVAEKNYPRKNLCLGKKTIYSKEEKSEGGEQKIFLSLARI
jgi:hypothetical protein